MLAGTRPGPRHPLRRVRRRRLAMALLGLSLLGLTLSTRASAAAEEGGEPARHVDVVQVSGWIDPVVVDFLRDTLDSTQVGGAEVLIIQLDSPGAVVDDEALADLGRRIRA